MSESNESRNGNHDRFDETIDELEKFFSQEEPKGAGQAEPKGTEPDGQAPSEPKIRLEDFLATHPEPPRRRGVSRGWMVATLALACFLAGAAAMRLFPSVQASATTAVFTAQPAAMRTAAGATQAPSNSVPPLGGASVTGGREIDIPAIAKNVGPSVVGVTNKTQGMTMDSLSGEVTQGTGSGVIVSSDGYIVTNNHVIAGADAVSVTLPGGQEIEAKIVGADEQTDLAVLKIDATGLTAAPIGDSDQMQVGQTVIAIGNPLGTELAGTVTAGILSARDRELIVDGYKFKLFQTDAAINPGNSGGALVNTKGELIAINNLKSVSAGTDEYGQTISAEGIGFAIPINDAMPVIRQLIANGYIPRPILGIDASQEITDRMAARYRVPVGVFLRQLTQGGPAEKAGIQAGDILTKIDGTAVATLADMNGILGQHNVGDTVKVAVWRDNREITVDVLLEGKTK